MKIDQVQALMTRYGVDPVAFRSLAEYADNIEGHYIEPSVAGLDETESIVLTSAVLRRFARELDLTFEHPDVLADAGFVVAEPMSIVDAPTEERAAASRQYFSDNAA